MPNIAVYAYTYLYAIELIGELQSANKVHANIFYTFQIEIYAQ